LTGRRYAGATYVILSRLAPDAFKDLRELKQVAATVAEKIKAECPAVIWKDSYLTLWRFDVLTWLSRTT